MEKYNLIWLVLIYCAVNNIAERTHIFAKEISFKELNKMVIVQNILKFSENLVKTEIYCSDIAFPKTTKSNFGLLALFKEVQGDKECLN